MRLTLAVVALATASTMAFAQTTPGTGPTTATTATAPTVAPAAIGTPAISMPSTNGGAQMPGATVNTPPNATTRSPSAVQTRNTDHRTGAAPVPGRNSFTMAEAARRISAAGFTQVTGLKKDRQGIWRGQAQKDGSATSVSLDYQGSVTGQ